MWKENTAVTNLSIRVQFVLNRAIEEKSALSDYCSETYFTGDMFVPVLRLIIALI